MKNEKHSLNTLKTEAGLRIEIPATGDAVKNGLLFFWLFAWTVSGMIIITYYFQLKEGNTKAATLVWIAFWAYFEYKISMVFAWRKFGKEIIEIKKGDLLIKKDYAGRGKIMSYNLEQVKDIRINENFGKGFFAHMNNAYWSLGDGKVAFDYFGREVTLGLQLDDKTAKELVRMLKGEVRK